MKFVRDIDNLNEDEVIDKIKEYLTTYGNSRITLESFPCDRRIVENWLNGKTQPSRASIVSMSRFFWKLSRETVIRENKVLIHKSIGLAKKKLIQSELRFVLDYWDISPHIYFCIFLDCIDNMDEIAIEQIMCKIRHKFNL